MLEVTAYFNADTSARQLLKGITSRCGYYRCERCITKDDFILNRVSFHELNAN